MRASVGLRVDGGWRGVLESVGKVEASALELRTDSSVLDVEDQGTVQGIGQVPVPAVLPCRLLDVLLRDAGCNAESILEQILLLVAGGCESNVSATRGCLAFKKLSNPGTHSITASTCVLTLS